MRTRLALLVGATALPVAAWAVPPAGPYTGDGWKVAALAVIVVAQWLTLVMAGKCPVGRALLAASVGTAAYGVALANLPMHDFAGPLCALVVGAPITWAVLTAGRRNEARPSLKRGKLLQVILYMNLVTMWFVPEAGVVNASRAYADTSHSVSNLRAVGEGLGLYAEAHGGGLPRVSDTATLMLTLRPYKVPDACYYGPYRKWWQVSASQTPELLYLMLSPWPTKMPNESSGASSLRVLLADPPLPQAHDIACLYADGHTQRMSDSTFQSILNSKDHTRRR